MLHSLFLTQREPFMDPLLKSFHLLFAALFLGNLVVSAIWKNLADRSGVPEVRLFGARVVLLTDLIFVAVCGIGLISTGFVQAMSWFPEGGLLKAPWIYLPLGSVTVVGLVWSLVLLPIELRQRTLATEALETDIVSSEYVKLSMRWNLLAALIAMLAIGVLFVMVYKPQPS